MLVFKYIYNLSQKSLLQLFPKGQSDEERGWIGRERRNEGHVVEGRLLSILWKSRRSLSLDPRRSLCSPLQSWNSSASGCCGSFIIPRNGIHITGTPFIHHVSEARPDGFIRLYPDPWAPDLYFNRFLSFRARALLTPLPERICTRENPPFHWICSVNSTVSVVNSVFITANKYFIRNSKIISTIDFSDFEEGDEKFFKI